MSNPASGELLVILLDDNPALEFDHAKTVPQKQLDYLDNMDQRMDAGVTLDGQQIAEPDLETRVRFVAQAMAQALLAGNDGLAVAMCTWLGLRRPQLKQVHIESGALGVKVDLDYENVYQKPEPEPQVVEFFPNKD